jgi:hypothetical protein
MNVNLSTGAFTGSPVFWSALTGIVLIALATLALARLRDWI